MFDPLPPAIAMHFRRMKANSGLNAGFLVRRNHKFIRTKAAALTRVPDTDPAQPRRISPGKLCEVYYEALDKDVAV